MIVNPLVLNAPGRTSECADGPLTLTANDGVTHCLEPSVELAGTKRPAMTVAGASNHFDLVRQVFRLAAIQQRERQLIEQFETRSRRRGPFLEFAANLGPRRFHLRIVWASRQIARVEIASSAPIKVLNQIHLPVRGNARPDGDEIGIGVDHQQLQATNRPDLGRKGQARSADRSNHVEKRSRSRPNV